MTWLGKITRTARTPMSWRRAGFSDRQTPSDFAAGHSYDQVFNTSLRRFSARNAVADSGSYRHAMGVRTSTRANLAVCRVRRR